MKKNKKTGKTINKFIAKSKKEYALLKRKSAKAVAEAKREWKASEPKRKALGVKARTTAKKIGKKSKTLFAKSVEIEKGLAQGLKIGIKNSKKIK